MSFDDAPRGDAPKANLFVGNLSYNTTEENLTDIFSEYGKVEKVQIPLDRDTGRKKGFAFIWMENAEAALEAVNGREVDTRTIRVELSTGVRSARPRDGGGYRGGDRRDFDRRDRRDDRRDGGSDRRDRGRDFERRDYDRRDDRGRGGDRSDRGGRGDRDSGRGDRDGGRGFDDRRDRSRDRY